MVSSSYSSSNQRLSRIIRWLRLCSRLWIFHNSSSLLNKLVVLVYNSSSRMLMQLCKLLLSLLVELRI